MLKKTYLGFSAQSHSLNAAVMSADVNFLYKIIAPQGQLLIFLWFQGDRTRNFNDDNYNDRFDRVLYNDDCILSHLINKPVFFDFRFPHLILY